MRILWILFCSIFLAVPVLADYTLAVFGDSLSAGYHLPQKDSFYAQLEGALQSKGYAIRVLNASKSGETTAGGLRKIPTLLAQKPDGVILELGVNDSHKNTPIATTQNNLKQMIETLQKGQIPVLLAGMKAFPFTPKSYQNQFEEMYRDLASTYHLDFYPFFMEGIFDSEHVLNPKMQNDYLLPHDFHPNDRGISIMVQGILPTVEHFLNNQGLWPKQ